MMSYSKFVLHIPWRLVLCLGEAPHISIRFDDYVTGRIRFEKMIDGFTV